MHLRVSAVLFVLGGFGGIDDGCIHDGTAVHNAAVFFHERLHSFKILLGKTVLDYDLSEFAQCRCVRYALFQKVQMHEFPHGIAVVDRIFQPLVREVVPCLKQVHPEHGLDPSRFAAFLVVVVIRLNHGHHFIPWRDRIHALKKFFPLRLPLALAIFYICEIRLSLHDLAPWIHFTRSFRLSHLLISVYLGVRSEKFL